MEDSSDIEIEAEDGSKFHCHKCILVARLGMIDLHQITRVFSNFQFVYFIFAPIRIDR